MNRQIFSEKHNTTSHGHGSALDGVEANTPTLPQYSVDGHAALDQFFYECREDATLGNGRIVVTLPLGFTALLDTEAVRLLQLFGELAVSPFQYSIRVPVNVPDSSKSCALKSPSSSIGITAFADGPKWLKHLNKPLISRLFVEAGPS